jgi:hypothetical protein
LQLAGVHWLISSVAALAALLSPSVGDTFTDASPHTLFLLLTLALAFVIGRTSRLIYAEAILLAAVVATLELSLIVIVAVLCLTGTRLLLHRRLPRPSGKPLLAFVLALFVLWPGGVIRGGYGLSYGVFLFQALFRRGGYFGTATIGEILLRASDRSVPILLVLAAVALLAAFLLLRGRFDGYMEIVGWLTMGFAAQGALNKFHNPTYTAHFVVFSCVLAALCLQKWISRSSGLLPKAGSVAVLAILPLAIPGWHGSIRERTIARDQMSQRVSPVIGYLRQLPPDAVIVANADRPVWRYYTGRRVEESAEGSGTPVWPLGNRNYWLISDPALLREGWRSKITISAEVPFAAYTIYHCTFGEAGIERPFHG